MQLYLEGRFGHVWLSGNIKQFQTADEYIKTAKKHFPENCCLTIRQWHVKDFWGWDSFDKFCTTLHKEAWKPRQKVFQLTVDYSHNQHFLMHNFLITTNFKLQLEKGHFHSQTFVIPSSSVWWRADSPLRSLVIKWSCGWECFCFMSLCFWI